MNDALDFQGNGQAALPLQPRPLDTARRFLGIFGC
jgi:hypothetical protein